ncbi:ribonuclease T2 [Lasiosphaeria miniovina]|uniref:ribonuclease T2 n=1 Tax=Lasiosphaeria miniovina TaxID=1954250 RepID=A0AA40DVQ7_9PEZI|nr:ribonuclease T2 [Lasiosphaeria miniovina]KAK0713508.1 ribonuclease T2 [Lasiosphaeria miniovina]
MARFNLLRLAVASSLSIPVVLAGSIGDVFGSSKCLFSKPELSCSAAAQSGLVDSCCVETLGGLVISTQFWDTYTGRESLGQLLPKNSFTLHGLWPDFCNGSWTQYCDLNRQYDPNPSPNTTTGTPAGTPVPPYHGPTVDTFLAALGLPGRALLAWMNKFWIAQGQPNTEFWAHEFSKHATCYSTFAPSCFSAKALDTHTDLLTFFSVAAEYFTRLPTYEWLAAKAIRPSNSTGYTLVDIQSTLAARHGATPYLGCSGPKYNDTAAGKGSLDNGRTVLTEIWYYYHIYGQVQAGSGKPVGADVNGGSTSSCAKAAKAVWYYERTPGSERWLF